jgi:hypothetical protein
MSEEEKVIFQTLYSKYNKLGLSKVEMSLECGCSTSTLDRLRNQSLGCSYKKESNGDICYPLTEIAKYYSRVILTA